MTPSILALIDSVETDETYEQGMQSQCALDGRVIIQRSGCTMKTAQRIDLEHGLGMVIHFVDDVLL